MPTIHLSSEDALILSSNCCNEYSCLFWLPAILSELVSTSISATPTPPSAALPSLGPLTHGLYHVLLLLYCHHRIPTTEFTYICMYYKTDFNFCSASQREREQQERSTRQLCLCCAEWAIEATAASSFCCAQLSTFPELASLCTVWNHSTSHSLQTTARLLPQNFNNIF